MTTALPPIIGLAGPARVGKDTAAAGLVADHGYTRYAFADAVRAMARAVDPHVAVDVENDDGEVWMTTYPRLADLVDAVGWEAAKAYPDVRRILQRMGTEGARSTFGDDVWIRRLREDWHGDGYPRAVIPDVRFPNEAEWIASEGGVVVAIRRPGHDGVGHVSETWDASEWPTVINDSTPADLVWRVVTAAQEASW